MSRPLPPPSFDTKHTEKERAGWGGVLVSCKWYGLCVCVCDTINHVSLLWLRSRSLSLLSCSALGPIDAASYRICKSLYDGPEVRNLRDDIKVRRRRRRRC